MNMIISELEKRIGEMEKSLDAEINFTMCPGVYTTESGRNRLYRIQNNLLNLKSELEALKALQVCSCSLVRKWFKSIFNTSMYKFKHCPNLNHNFEVHHCSKCDGYYSILKG